MKKKTCLVVLAALTWLNAYQIGDAGEDAVEDIQTRIQNVALPGPVLSTPTLPDDDDDVDLPFIVSQALVHNPPSIWTTALFSHDLATAIYFVSYIVVGHESHNLSPPNFLKNRACDVFVLSQKVFVRSVRSLAPPLPIL